MLRRDGGSEDTIWEFQHGASVISICQKGRIWHNGIPVNVSQTDDNHLQPHVTMFTTILHS
jgi:hypothetical protein